MNTDLPIRQLIQVNIDPRLRSLPPSYDVTLAVELYNAFARLQQLAGKDEFKALMMDTCREAKMSVPTMQKYQKLLETRGFIEHVGDRYFRLHAGDVNRGERDYISEGDINSAKGTTSNGNKVKLGMLSKPSRRRSRVKLGLRDDSENRALVSRGLQSTGQGQPYRLVSVAMRKLTMALREGASKDDLLLILDWAERERKTSRFTGLRDLTWLWGSRWSTHLACAKGNRSDISGNESDLTQSLRRGGKQWGT